MLPDRCHLVKNFCPPAKNIHPFIFPMQHKESAAFLKADKDKSDIPKHVAFCCLRTSKRCMKWGKNHQTHTQWLLKAYIIARKSNIIWQIYHLTYCISLFLKNTTDRYQERIYTPIPTTARAARIALGWTSATSCPLKKLDAKTLAPQTIPIIK